MIAVDANVLLRYSNNDRCNPDCRITDISVPVRSSLWSGTGTVTVLPPGMIFCITTWLLRLLTSIKPWLASIRHTSLPDRTLSLTNRNLNVCYIYFIV